MIQIVAVPPWEARRAGQLFRELIDRACSHGCQETPGSLIADAADNKAIIWIIADGNTPIAVCITRKAAMPDGTMIIRGEVLGGTRAKEWARPLRARLHDYRKAEEAKVLVWGGRKGWARHVGVTPEKDVGGNWLFKDFGNDVK